MSAGEVVGAAPVPIPKTLAALLPKAVTLKPKFLEVSIRKASVPFWAMVIMSSDSVPMVNPVLADPPAYR